jgi:proline utilization trans-activator
MLATRPVALHVLRMQMDILSESPSRTPSQVNDTALALSEACIRCARSTYRLLTDSWINGSFPTFDYTYTQYLFSASIILAMSSLSKNREAYSDGEDFEAAAELLRELDQNGNYAAKEFSRHIGAIKTVLETSRSAQEQSGLERGAHEPSRLRTMPKPSQHAGISSDGILDAPRTDLMEASLQEILSHDNLDLRFLEPSFSDDSSPTFFWPDVEMNNWITH